MSAAIDDLHDQLASLTEENERLRGFVKFAAHIVDGQEGRTTMTMQMHGFSPVKALQELRDKAKALSPIDPPLGQEVTE